jgi:hypothetical protein
MADLSTVCSAVKLLDRLCEQLEPKARDQLHMTGVSSHPNGAGGVAVLSILNLAEEPVQCSPTDDGRRLIVLAARIVAEDGHQELAKKTAADLETLLEKKDVVPEHHSLALLLMAVLHKQRGDRDKVS